MNFCFRGVEIYNLAEPMGASEATNSVNDSLNHKPAVLSVLKPHPKAQMSSSLFGDTMVPNIK